ncbi:aldehyde dehydrogenase family protein [uncultured Aurantimicrobium sp.]|uniref:aldehyde dehydrogenase family protein n=1 Tax=uncultured Aurantimicrobium sp. TaxID=1705357 RepID=UPI00260C3189|nr:aldehyde dehydrogenase family protein [uncultured Aurantimicrobium sp.]
MGDKDIIRTGLFIGGASRDTVEHLEIADPAKRGEVVGYAAAATKQNVDYAISVAKNAFPAWSSLSAIERADLMSEAIQGIAEARDDDAAVLSRENGKVRFEGWIDSLVFEIRWNLALMIADQVDTGKTLPVAPGIPVSTEVQHQPLGVVTIIVPFNWPIAILGAALPHALLAGNTVIVKPPLTAPLATTRVIERIAAKLPAGVLNVVTGKDEDMAALIESEDIAKVCFTGSVGGGKRIMSMASKALTRVTLELGGNDAAIFLEDAIIDDTHLDRLYGAIFDTTGQICMNAKRIYVHESRMDEVVDGLTARLEKVKLGYGLDPDTTMGPLHAPSQKAFVEKLIREAKDAGADVREFGELPTGELAAGNFVRPALVVNPDPSLGVVVEEQFGPVIPLIPFSTEAEAIAAANDTWAGLAGSVWTADPVAANRVGSKLQCGYVWINDHGATRLDLRAPFGGMKNSGFGREQGIEGIRAFQDTRSIATIDAEALAAQAH